MKHLLLQSLLVTLLTAAHSLLPVLGLLNLLLLWAATHAVQLHGFTLLCKALGAVIGLAYGGVKLALPGAATPVAALVQLKPVRPAYSSEWAGRLALIP